MRTNFGWISRGWILISLSLTILVVGGPAILAREVSPQAEAGNLTTDDLARLARFHVTPASSASPVSLEDAVNAANREYEWGLLGERPSMVAALQTVSLLDPTGEKVVERLVWVIHVGGLRQTMPGPWTPDGQLDGTVLTNAYVFIDGQTAEFLMTTWTE